MKKILKNAGKVLLVILLVLLVVKVWADRTYFDNYDPELPLDPQVMERETVEGDIEFFGLVRPARFEKEEFCIQVRPNERMQAVLTFPLDRDDAVPVVIFVHGSGMDRTFVEEVGTPFNEAGFAMASFDQASVGEREVQGGMLRQAHAFRQLPWKVVNDTRRLMDHLQTHPEIDSERIYLVGASFGAVTGANVVALDDRIRAASLIVGGANIPVILEAPAMREEVGNRLLYWIAGKIFTFVMNPADPIHYAAQTAGTPILMQNAEHDTLVTPAAGKELYNALGEPKEIRWYPCEHPGMYEEEAPIVEDMLNDALQWLLQQDANR